LSLGDLAMMGEEPVDILSTPHVILLI